MLTSYEASVDLETGLYVSMILIVFCCYNNDTENNGNAPYASLTLLVQGIPADFQLPPSLYGEFGGYYSPQTLFESFWKHRCTFWAMWKLPAFQAMLKHLYKGYPGSALEFAPKLTESAGGAKIWLKREDLNANGGIHIHNAIGQALFVKMSGNRKITTATADPEHGLAMAAVCTFLELECVIFIGMKDVERYPLRFEQMKSWGIQITVVETGSAMFADAEAEALNLFTANLSPKGPEYVFVPGHAEGSCPLPEMVQCFQSRIGLETRWQMIKYTNKLPDALVACASDGAVGMFSEFLRDKQIRRVAIEAGGQELRSGLHSAVLTCGRLGVRCGMKTLVLQTEDGQTMPTQSVAARLNSPVVPPPVADWNNKGLITPMTIYDHDAVKTHKLVQKLTGQRFNLESAHAISGAMKLARTMEPNQNIVVCCTGAGDNDTQRLIDSYVAKHPILK